MKTNSKKLFVSILATIMFLTICLGLTFGSKTTASAKSPYPSFKMEVGASIRLKDTYEKNGMRFTATVNKAEFDAYNGENTATAGFFIMPYYYIDKFGALTSENCFGESAVYTWEGKTGSGTHAIIHVEDVAIYLAEETDEFYTLNGSVVNMRDENLNVDYVGVAYILIDGDYVFAQSNVEKNARSVVTVAQKALTDVTTIYEQEEQDAMKFYFTKYLTKYNADNGENPKFDVATNVYVNTYENGYVKNNALSTTTSVELTQVSDFVDLIEFNKTDAKYGNYAVVNKGENVLSAVPNFGSELNVYMNQVKYEGFGEEAVDNSILSSRKTANGGSIIAGNGNPVYANGGDVEGLGAFRESDVFSLYGNKSLYVDVRSNGWGSLTWGSAAEPAIKLPVATNLFSMVIKTSAIWTTGENRLKAQMWFNNSYKVDFNIPEEGETARVYLQTTAMLDSIWKFDIMTDWGASAYGQKAYFIDDIRWEMPVKVNASNVVINTRPMNDTYTLSVSNFTSGIASTMYSQEELAAQDVTLSYKQLPSGTVTPVTDSADIDVVNKSYEVSVSVGGQSSKVNVLGFYTNMITSFDFENETKVDASTLGYGGDKTFSLLNTENSVDGDNACLNIVKSNGWSGFDSKELLTFETPCTTLCFWIKNNLKETLNKSHVWLSKGGSPSASVTLSGVGCEWTYVEFTFASSITQFKTFAVENTSSSAFANCYIDRVALR